MNTNFIFVSNIPKCQIQSFSKSLDSKLDNKWSKAIYIDDPFSESLDAFIYNPTSSLSHFDIGIEKLRRKEEGFSVLQVYYVYFPPPNVNVTSLIPEGSIMLPYLIIDSIPKHVEVHDIIGDLPFKANDFKEWDVPFKDDKWIILRLPKSTDEITRNYVLCYLRNKRLSKGILPRVTEVFISEDPRLSNNMIPKIWKSLTMTNSYRSNLIFIYDLPAKISSHDIIDSMRDIDCRHCKAHIIDVVDQLKLGFISTQKSMSEYKFEELMRKLASMEIEVANLGTKLKLNTSEVWLQPINCDPPRVKKSESDSKVEFILTNYIYLHNLSSTIQQADITVKAPVTFRVNLYNCTDSRQQIGFVSVMDMNEWKVNKIVDYLRSLVFEGLSVLVDEVWIKEYNLPDVGDRRPVHVSRKATRCIEVVQNRTIEALDILEEINLHRQYNVKCAEQVPPFSNLVKSDLVLLMNLPVDFNGTSSLFDMKVSFEGLSFMESGNEKIGFLYYRQASNIKWLDFLEKICSFDVDGKRIVVKEIYLMCDETIELIQLKLPSIYLSNYVFVYNIALDGDMQLDELSEHSFAVKHVYMNTDCGARCAFVQLRDDLNPYQILEVLRYIRTVKICGKVVCADLIWLANVSVIDTMK